MAVLHLPDAAEVALLHLPACAIQTVAVRAGPCFLSAAVLMLQYLLARAVQRAPAKAAGLPHVLELHHQAAYYVVAGKNEQRCGRGWHGGKVQRVAQRWRRLR